ncbi:hypothetical protein L1D41_19300 [Vibrio harveyi]|nr:hypothetical protein [Vibrio harveyi]MCG9611787.1 hypothetical protein [Vibrio harveyi]MCG9669989.1 hypothetical protein [Vibrio harveyi]
MPSLGFVFTVVCGGIGIALLIP